jgi:hypothetical protein
MIEMLDKEKCQRLSMGAGEESATTTYVTDAIDDVAQDVSIRIIISLAYRLSAGPASDLEKGCD